MTGRRSLDRRGREFYVILLAVCVAGLAIWAAWFSTWGQP